MVNNCVDDLEEEPENTDCGWWLSDEAINTYSTTCGTEFMLNHGKPRANGFKYCPFCGKKIRLAP